MIYCTQEVRNMLNKLLVMERGLVFLSAPTNGGKTTIIKEITKRKEKAIAISSEQLTDAILQKTLHSLLTPIGMIVGQA